MQHSSCSHRVHMCQDRNSEKAVLGGRGRPAAHCQGPAHEASWHGKVLRLGGGGNCRAGKASNGVFCRHAPAAIAACTGNLCRGGCRRDLAALVGAAACTLQCCCCCWGACVPSGELAAPRVRPPIYMNKKTEAGRNRASSMCARSVVLGGGREPAAAQGSTTLACKVHRYLSAHTCRPSKPVTRLETDACGAGLDCMARHLCAVACRLPGPTRMRNSQLVC